MNHFLTAPLHCARGWDLPQLILAGSASALCCPGTAIISLALWYLLSEVTSHWTEGQLTDLLLLQELPCPTYTRLNVLNKDLTWIKYPSASWPAWCGSPGRMAVFWDLRCLQGEAPLTLRFPLLVLKVWLKIEVIYSLTLFLMSILNSHNLCREMCCSLRESWVRQ